MNKETEQRTIDGLTECPFCERKFKVEVDRNYELFKKWWALVQYAFKHWEPPEIDEKKYKNVIPLKSFKQFRKDLTILAGHYEAFVRLDGSVRIEAKSVSYKEFPTDESFEPFYSATVDAVLKHILKNYTGEELERCVLEVMSFT